MRKEELPVRMRKKATAFKDMHGYTALMLAVINGHTKCVKLLKDFEFWARDKIGGRTALMLAVISSKPKCAKVLVVRECSQSNYHDESRTALMYAVQYEEIECVKILMKYELNCKDKHGDTALQYAERSGNEQCMKLLKRCKPTIK